MSKRIKESYSNFDKVELENEKESLIESLKDLYLIDIEGFKYIDCNSVGYCVGGSSISKSILSSLGYDYVIQGSTLYLKLKNDCDLEQSIKLFKKYKLMHTIVTLVQFILCIFCLFLMFYGIKSDIDIYGLSNVVLSLSFISLLLFILSIMYSNKAKENVILSKL